MSKSSDFQKSKKRQMILKTKEFLEVKYHCP